MEGFRQLYPWQPLMSCVCCSVATVLRRFWFWSKTYTDRQKTVEAHCSMLGETTLGPATALVDQCLTDEEAAVVSLQHFLARRLVSLLLHRRVWNFFMIPCSLSICLSMGLPFLQGHRKHSHLTMTDPCTPTSPVPVPVPKPPTSTSP